MDKFQANSPEKQATLQWKIFSIDIMYGCFYLSNYSIFAPFLVSKMFYFSTTFPFLFLFPFYKNKRERKRSKWSLFIRLVTFEKWKKDSSS
jgi:hypothetical protein